ncbi:unnamed protein product [Prunus armeniaca]
MEVRKARQARQASRCYCGKVARLLGPIQTQEDYFKFVHSNREELTKDVFQDGDTFLRKIDRLEEENAKIQLKSRILVIALVLSWLITRVVIME